MDSRTLMEEITALEREVEEKVAALNELIQRLELKRELLTRLEKEQLQSAATDKS